MAIEWRPFDPAEFPDPSWEGFDGRHFLLPVGYIVRDRTGTMWLVGDINETGWTFGCGCCADDVDIVEIADLTGDIEGWER